MLKLATNSKQLHKAYSVIIAVIMFIASMAVAVDPNILKLVFSNERAYAIVTAIFSAAIVASRYIKQFDLDAFLRDEEEKEAAKAVTE